jgi:glycosyltransferase involved in cell wall biosynthesis
VVVVAHDVGGVGGMERQLSELVSGLLGEGWGVTVLSRSCQLPAQPGLRWVRVPGPARPFPLAYPWFGLAAGLLLLRHRRGLVHSTGAIVPNRADVVTVHLCHHAIAEQGVARFSRTHPGYRLNARLAGLLSRLGERWCYSPGRAGHLVGVSGGVRAELLRHTAVDPSRITVIPNGADTRTFRPDPQRRLAARRRLGLSTEDLVAVFVGSEWEGKGLLHALGGVARAPYWHLVVVGRGDEVRYRRLSRELGVERRTHFVGLTADTPSYYATGDAFLLPSAYETFSLVTYEAAAAGLPVLATRVSGVEDLVQDGLNGWFIEPRAQDIARRLRQLEADPDLRRAMGRSSREAAQDFGWERAVAAYRELYRSLGAGGPETPDRPAPGRGAPEQPASEHDSSEMEAAPC